MITLDVQDILCGNYVVPHTVGDGFVDRTNPVVMRVRRITVPICIIFRPGKEYVFQPDSSLSNIEYIESICILLNDALPPPDLSSYISTHTMQIDLPVERWCEYVADDSMPSTWFVQYRSECVFRVTVVVSCGDKILCNVVPGTKWEDSIKIVQKAMDLMSYNDGPLKMEKQKLPFQHSPPARPRNAEETARPYRKEIVEDFLGLIGEESK